MISACKGGGRYHRSSCTKPAAPAGLPVGVLFQAGIETAGLFLFL